MSSTNNEAVMTVLAGSGFTTDLSKEQLIGLTSGGESQFFAEKPTFQLKDDERWIIEKINFNDSCPIRSIQLMEEEKKGRYYAQIKTQTGDKYFFNLTPSHYYQLRQEAYLNPAIKDAFIDRSFNYLDTALMAEKFSDYWIGLSGYKPVTQSTYDAIHQDMVAKLKERISTLPEGTKLRLIEIGCGRAELMKKALSDPQIAPLVSRVVLLDLYAENIGTASENVKAVNATIPCDLIAKGMPDGIDDIPSAPDEYTLVLSSGSLTHQVLTQDQAIQTMEKLHEKADEVIVGGLTNSWINKKVAKQLGFSVEQQPKIKQELLKTPPLGPDGEPWSSYRDEDMVTERFAVIKKAASDLVTVFKREDQTPQAATSIRREPKSLERHFDLKSKFSKVSTRPKDEDEFKSDASPNL